MKQRKAAAWLLAGFLTMMFLCTLISRGLYASGLPRVVTGTPDRRPIGHAVEAEGSIVPGKELAVNIPQGIRVREVFIQPGDAVGPGTLLFSADQKDLGELIKEKELEIEKLRLGIEDMERNESLDSAKKGLDRKRAAQDAADGSQNAGKNVERHQQDLQKAEEELASHLAERPEVTDQKERDRQNQDYENRVREEKELQKQIISLDRQIGELQLDSDGNGSVSGNQSGDRNGSQSEDQSGDRNGNQSGNRNGNQSGNQNENPSGDQGGNQNENQSSVEADLLSQKQKELAALKEKLSVLQLDSAEKPDYGAEDGEVTAWEEKKLQLENAVEDAKRGLEDAGKQQEESLRQGEREMEDAAWPEQADSTARQNRLTMELEQERLEEYRRIYEAGGEVYGEQPGFVTELGICSGDRTADSPVIRYAAENSPFRLKASLTKEQKKYVNPGDMAEVSLGNGRKLELEITYLAESETAPGTYDLEIDLPGQDGILGMSGSVRVKTQSDSYECCVPAEALYSENQRYYVYAVGHKQTILGDELAVEKIPVTVLDQNENYAALEPGVITPETEVIVRSDKEVKEGEIVRYME